MVTILMSGTEGSDQKRHHYVLAPLLGVKGHRGYVTRRLVTLFLYPKAITQPVKSLFAAIIQDEGLPTSS